MDKLEIQQRVLQNGKPLDLDKFEWDEKTRTFSTDEKDLLLDFEYISDLTIKTSTECKITAYQYCNIICGSNCYIQTNKFCNIDTGSNCKIYSECDSIINALIDCKIYSKSRSIIKAGDNSTIEGGFDLVITAGHRCDIKTFDNCSFKVESNSKINAGWRSKINAGWGSIIKVESNSIINADLSSTINAHGNEIVIIKSPVFEVIQPKKGDIIEIYPLSIKGHLVNGIHSITGKKSIIADGILSEIVSKKGNVYKVINHGETKKSFLIEKEINNKKYYSHGATLKEAKESLVFKISDRDLSKWKHLKLDSEVSFEEAVMLYRDITGACREGTKYFVDQNIDKKKDKYSIKELLKITKDQYGYSEFKNFFNK